LYVNATSLAVKGSPSFHFTPSRTLMVIEVPSSFHSKDSPSSGVGAASATLLK